MHTIDYATVPVDYMAGAMQRYVEQGIEPGSFLRALLSNDLRGAIARADGMNVARIPHWVVWMENNLPGGAWGSSERYESWILRCGLAGRCGRG
jgi:hypothetical protein